MINLIVRALLILAGTITAWFVAKDEPNYGFIQGMVAILLFAFIVLILALWPRHWRR